MSTTYLYARGLKEAAERLRGDETIHMGIRPFGYHAGNRLTLAVYPIRLMELRRAAGLDVRFRFVLSINDWEPYAVRYIDKQGLPYNLFPERTTFQYTQDPLGCHDSVTEHWQPVIASEIRTAFAPFPDVQLDVVRNSQLGMEPVFQRALKWTLHKPDELGRIIQDVTGETVRAEEAQFAGAVCPLCRSAQGVTASDDSEVSYECSDCGKSSRGALGSFDYWWHHVPLLVPRLCIFGVEVCVRGGDHYLTKRVELNAALLRAFSADARIPASIIAPQVVSYDGRKMSKALDNGGDVDQSSLLKLARHHDDSLLTWSQLSSACERAAPDAEN